MKTTLIILCLVVTAFGLVSCGKKKSPATAETSPAPETRQKVEIRPIVVKGFYIGMTPPEITQAARKNIPEFQLSQGRSLGIEGFVCQMPASITKALTENYSNKRYMVGMAEFVVCATKENKVVEFDIGPLAVDYLFSAKDLNVDEFVQKFSDAYNLPKFTYRRDPDDPNGEWVWDYESPDNVLVRIYGDAGRKTVIMKKLKTSNPKNGFN